MMTGDKRMPGLATCLRAMRVHQWVKNLLVFVPLVTSHQLADGGLLAGAALAFLSLSLCASGSYLLNDIRDAAADRQHPGKRNRPVASGEMSPGFAAVLGGLLLLSAFALAFWLPRPFGILLGLYLGISLAYSLALKSLLAADVMVLAGLYTLRLLAGGAATGIEISFWLLAFSLFLFLSLALVKRYSELLSLKPAQDSPLPGRSYRYDDAPILSQAGLASGFLAALVLALYINSPEVSVLYGRPEVLWLLCPLLLYWTSRVWLLASRDRLHEDPVVFTLKDPVSWGVAAAGLLIMWMAR